MKSPTASAWLEALEGRWAETARRLAAVVNEEAAGLPIEVRPEALWYGPYRYRYATGRTGETARIILWPRKGYVALYLCEGLHEPIAGTDAGAGCLRIKSLEKVDLAALRRELRRVAREEPKMLDTSRDP